MRRLFLILYYAIGYYLPGSTTPIIGGVCKQIRALLCRRLFAYAGKKINIGRHVYFGLGSTLQIGDLSGLGNGTRIQQTHLSIGEHVMTAENLLILGGGTSIVTLRFQ